MQTLPTNAFGLLKIGYNNSHLYLLRMNSRSSICWGNMVNEWCTQLLSLVNFQNTMSKTGT